MTTKLLSRVTQTLKYTARFYRADAKTVAKNTIDVKESYHTVLRDTLMVHKTAELGDSTKQNQIVQILSQHKHEKQVSLGLLLLAGKYLAEEKAEDCCCILQTIGFKHLATSVALKDLVAIALELGDPLIAANLCLDSGTQSVSKDLVSECLKHLFLTSYPSKIGLTVFAASRLLSRSDAPVTLSVPDKARMVSSALKSTRDQFGQTLALANRCYDLAGSSDLPVQVAYTLITRNLRCGNTGRALQVWKDIKLSPQRESQIHKHDVGILSILLTRFSKTKFHLSAAREIARAIPEDMYNLPGLTESLFRYCARDKNAELAQTLYRALKPPVSRTVLSTLLALHLSLNDVEGAMRIVAEIQTRGSANHEDNHAQPKTCIEDLIGEQAAFQTELSVLKDHELAHMAKAIARDSIERAVQFVKALDVKCAARAIAQVMDMAADRGDLDTATELLSLVRSRYAFSDPVYEYIPNIVLKGLCVRGDVDTAQELWDEWFARLTPEAFAGNRRVHSLQLILDETLRQDKSTRASWVFARLGACGLSRKDAFQLLHMRAGFRKLSPESRAVWIRQLELGFKRL